MILNDKQIIERARIEGMIHPYTNRQLRYRNAPGSRGQGMRAIPMISSGVSSFGYDVTLAKDVRVFTNAGGGEIDPKAMDEGLMVKAKVHVCKDKGKYIIIPPNSYALGHTVEFFNIPRDVLVVCLGKSTYARAGAMINVTPIEPGFKGQVVIEIANTTTLPMRVYVEEGIAQFVFHTGEPCEVSYGDRNGKYQGQHGITHSKV